MLGSYGFILQLRRSPIPCCAGNGTLVTRVRRVHLAREQASALGELHHHRLAVRLHVANVGLSAGWLLKTVVFSLGCSRVWVAKALLGAGVVPTCIWLVTGAQKLAGNLRPTVGRAGKANNCCRIMLQDSWEPGSALKVLVFHPVSFLPSYGFLVIAADDSADTPSENEFFAPHLVDSIHRVQLCQKKKKRKKVTLLPLLHRLPVVLRERTQPLWDAISFSCTVFPMVPWEVGFSICKIWP